MYPNDFIILVTLLSSHSVKYSTYIQAQTLHHWRKLLFKIKSSKSIKIGLNLTGKRSKCEKNV